MVQAHAGVDYAAACSLHVGLLEGNEVGQRM
jgi:hypothetical protein